VKEEKGVIRKIEKSSIEKWELGKKSPFGPSPQKGERSMYGKEGEAILHLAR